MYQNLGISKNTRNSPRPVLAPSLRRDVRNGIELLRVKLHKVPQTNKAYLNAARLQRTPPIQPFAVNSFINGRLLRMSHGNRDEFTIRSIHDFRDLATCQFLEFAIIAIDRMKVNGLIKIFPRLSQKSTQNARRRPPLRPLQKPVVVNFR